MAEKEKKKTSLEVNPSKKKKDDKKDVKSKAHMLIMKHPEVMYSARGLFRNENGKTIVEEVVPRGDPDQEEVIMPRTQGDLKDEDLRGLAVFAGELIDDTLKAYDPQVALEDALARAIATKDNGKYAGKVNASTFTLILDSMGKKAKKAAEEPKPEVIQKNSKEARMDKDLVLKEIEATKTKLAALEVLAGCNEESKEDKKEDKKEESKEAGKAEMIKCPDCGGKVLKATSYCLKCKKKIGGKKEEKDEKKKEEKDATGSIVASLDEIAGVLEEQKDPELLKVAFQLDLVSDVLEGKKEASCLEGDADERYMKEYFKAGMREGDADEKAYMGEFNTDMSTELNDKYPKGLGKDASEKLPYQVKK
jgi:DNA-directed RNA polymerase subunit RPC12/RpoP